MFGFYLPLQLEAFKTTTALFVMKPRTVLIYYGLQTLKLVYCGAVQVTYEAILGLQNVMM
jgi:hypothetical protein